MIKHGMNCPSSCSHSRLVVLNRFFFFSKGITYASQLYYATNERLKNILQNNHLKKSFFETHYWFGIWTEHKSTHYSFTYKLTTEGEKKHLFYHSLLCVIYNSNHTILHGPVSQDLSLSSHLPGQLKSKVTFQLVLKSITGFALLIAHVVLQMWGVEERYFQLYSLTLERDRWGWRSRCLKHTPTLHQGTGASLVSLPSPLLIYPNLCPHYRQLNNLF